MVKNGFEIRSLDRRQGFYTVDRAGRPCRVGKFAAAPPCLGRTPERYITERSFNLVVVIITGGEVRA